MSLGEDGFGLKMGICMGDEMGGDATLGDCMDFQAK
jgi:hypothetical protein